MNTLFLAALFSLSQLVSFFSPAKSIPTPSNLKPGVNRAFYRSCTGTYNNPAIPFGLIVQNSASYQESTVNAVADNCDGTGLAYGAGAALTLYPVGTPFGVGTPWTGGTPGLYNYTEPNGTAWRVISKDGYPFGNGGNNRILYMDAYQINFSFDHHNITTSPIRSYPFWEYALRFQVERLLPGPGQTWQIISTSSSGESYPGEQVANRPNAWPGHVVYVDAGSGYFALKYTNDGTPNPRTYAGNPVIIASYVSGAYRASQSSAGCARYLEIAGANATAQMQTNYINVISGTTIQQQVNWVVPPTIQDSDVIRFGAYPMNLFNSAQPNACVAGSPELGPGFTIDWQ